MEVELLVPGTTETVSILKNVTPGKIIRFPHDSFEDALKENLFYCVSKSDKGRTKLFNLSNGEIIERDEEWRVIQHTSKLLIQKD